MNLHCLIKEGILVIDGLVVRVLHLRSNDCDFNSYTEGCVVFLSVTLHLTLSSDLFDT